MNTRKFNTLIRADHRLGRDAFIQGKVAGIMKILCMKYVSGFGRLLINGKGLMLTTRCTKHQYEEFAAYVEVLYPGLCVFDYEIGE